MDSKPAVHVLGGNTPPGMVTSAHFGRSALYFDRHVLRHAEWLTSAKPVLWFGRLTNREVEGLSASPETGLSGERKRLSPRR